jgi:hypothetical protein
VDLIIGFEMSTALLTIQQTGQAQLINHSHTVLLMVEIISAIMLVALGFAPTYVLMEAAWRMGRMIGRRGEMPLVRART